MAGAKILVVDDERVIADTLRIVLEYNGYTAVSAYDGKEAIATAEVFHPDLLLSGVVMPGMDGFEAALQVKRLCPECRVVFFSGMDPAKLIPENFPALREYDHPVEILPKPVYPDDLLDKLKISFGLKATKQPA